jgi:hypothetical protein
MAVNLPPITAGDGAAVRSCQAKLPSSAVSLSDIAVAADPVHETGARRTGRRVKG